MPLRLAIEQNYNELAMLASRVRTT